MRLSKMIPLLFFSLSSIAIADQRDADIYFAYANKQHLYIEGRVIEKRDTSKVKKDDGWLKNLWRKAQRLVNDEKKFEAAIVAIGEEKYSVTTDEEGYFQIQEKAPAGLSPGWNPLEVILKDKTRVKSELLLVPEENRIGIISDFDDTLVYSNVLNKKDLLANSLLKNYKQRELVKGMPEMFQKISLQNPQPKATPIFIVSASPRQISRGIQQFLDYHHFPKGLVMTKTISGDDRDPLLDQKQYKINRIQEVFDRLPNVKFVLIGDDGEKDPESFNSLSNRYPDRIIGVWIHKVNTDPQRKRYPRQVLFTDSQDILKSREFAVTQN